MQATPLDARVSTAVLASKSNRTGRSKKCDTREVLEAKLAELRSKRASLDASRVVEQGAAHAVVHRQAARNLVRTSPHQEQEEDYSSLSIHFTQVTQPNVNQNEEMSTSVQVREPSQREEAQIPRIKSDIVDTLLVTRRLLMSAAIKRAHSKPESSIRKKLESCYNYHPSRDELSQYRSH